MARVPQVTRTIQTTKVNVMCVNIDKGETFTQELVLPRTYKDDKAILKFIENSSVIDNVHFKVVHVISAEVVETLYGMSEQKFIQLADVLPARGRKDEHDEQ